MLQLTGVAKTFAVGGGNGDPVTALVDVTLTIEAGRLTSVLGPSGSGKSTLLRIIAGFERPDRGVVTMGDRVLAGPGVFVRPERRMIGIVPQDGALFPHLDVAGNIAFGLAGTVGSRFGAQGRRARADRVAELLEMVGLPGYQRRRVDELSGGQQQRVALARALAPHPHVVLLDEPFSAIDAALRTELGAEVRALLRSLKITSVLVTHDQSEALSLADEVVVMREGRVAQTGTPQHVYENPADVETARFVGDAMVLPARVVDGELPSVCCALGTLPVAAAAAPGTDCHVVLRPENLVLCDADGPGVLAEVVSSAYYGHDAMVMVCLDGTDVGHVAGARERFVRVRIRDRDPASLVGRPVRVRVEGRPSVLN